MFDDGMAENRSSAVYFRVFSESLFFFFSFFDSNTIELTAFDLVLRMMIRLITTCLEALDEPLCCHAP